MNDGAELSTMASNFSLLILNVLIIVSLMTRPSEESASTGATKDHDNTTYEPTDDMTLPADAKQIRWAQAAYDFLGNQTCKEAFFSTEKECKVVQKKSRSEMSLYLAAPSAYGQLRAILPDGGLHKTGAHDAVMVLDPYPTANFGHLILVFYVELGVTQTWCHVEGGDYLDGGECLILALRKRCKNAIERRNRRRNFARRCEINFLPLVYLDGADNTGRTQLLKCRPNIPGFGPCVQLRTANETSGLFCDPVQQNTYRCETTHETVKTSCRVFEICDQAVIISGGWNRWSHRPYHKDNVWAMYKTLVSHGFNNQNIHIFFANGASGIIADNSTEIEQPVHPAVLKLAMRYHIQKMCMSPHCVDSLVLYLNSPAMSDGNMLLWDANRDGVMDENEVYTLAELLTDLSDCEARHVHIIADQSYSGELARAFRRSTSHHNVVVYASSRDNQYSYGDDFTRAWVYSNHTRKCMKHVFKDAKKLSANSTPLIHAGDNSANINIFGAPCDVIPHFTHDELKDNYLGCQNLPTALWVMKFLDGTPRKSPRLSPIIASRDYDMEADYANEDSVTSDTDDEYLSKVSKVSRENESYDMEGDDVYHLYDS